MTKKHFIWSFIGLFFGVLIMYFIFDVSIFLFSYARDFFSVKASSDIVIIENNNTLENEIIEIKNIEEEIILIEDKTEKTKGLLSFRGNPTRSYYGEGPIPSDPEIKWKYPVNIKEKMCSFSIAEGKKSLWCGTGWTGQPVVWEKENGEIEIIFGAYDGAVHFLNALNGEDIRKPFQTGDIIKGSVTLDPDGFPLLYFGSRDNKLRILSLDNQETKELWALDSTDLGGIWNDDWDGNPLIINDILYEGGENGWFYAIKLNRKINENNTVEVNPKIIFSMPSYGDELIKLVGENVSIENSLVFFENRVYFANSGGRILGLDISKIEEGIAPIVFDYWAGDDVDATMVIDEEGMLYVSVELERFNDRSKELGQFVKLNPYALKDPYVWGIKIPKENLKVGGIWATPALYKDYLFTTTHSGRLIEVNKNTGKIVWEEAITPHAWSSPVVVDDTLLVSTCGGEFRSYSLENIENPLLNWSFQASSSCIESTPAIWKGNIFVGMRDGFFYSVGEKL